MEQQTITEIFAATALLALALGGLLLLSKHVCPQLIVAGVMFITSAVAMGHGIHYNSRTSPPSPPYPPNYSGRPVEPHIVEYDHRNYVLTLREYETRRLEYETRTVQAPTPIVPVWVSLYAGVSGIFLSGIWLIIRLSRLYAEYGR